MMMTMMMMKHESFSLIRQVARICNHLIHGSQLSWSHESASKQYLDRFSRFCRIHGRKHTDTRTDTRQTNYVQIFAATARIYALCACDTGY